MNKKECKVGMRVIANIKVADEFDILEKDKIFVIENIEKGGKKDVCVTLKRIDAVDNEPLTDYTVTVAPESIMPYTLDNVKMAIKVLSDRIRIIEKATGVTDMRHELYVYTNMSERLMIQNLARRSTI